MNEVIVTTSALAAVEVTTTTTEVVVAAGSIQASVEITPPNQATIELGLTNIGIRGPVGPVGPAGPNEIGGYPVMLNSAQENDTLQLKSWAWKNVPQEALTDGGNF